MNSVDIKTGQDAFRDLFTKLSNIIAWGKTLYKKVIGENVWHLNTLLNTFNRYYCYDTNYEYVREIEPIFLNIGKGKKSRHVSRLLAIVAHAEIKESHNTIRFYFDRPCGLKGQPIIMRTLEEMVVQYDADEIFKVDYESIRGCYFGSVKKEWPKKSHVIQCTLPVNKQPYLIPPVFGDLIPEEKENDADPPASLHIDPNASPFRWYVNFAFVAKNRVFSYNGKKEEDVFVIRKMHTSYPSFIDEQAIAYLQHYLFGMDKNFVEDNFKSDMYKKRTCIPWTPDVQKQLEPLILDGEDILYAIETEYIENYLKSYDKERMIGYAKRDIIRNHNNIVEWRESMDIICRKIEMIVQVIANPNRVLFTSTNLLFSGMTGTKEEVKVKEEEEDSRLFSLTKAEEETLQKIYNINLENDLTINYLESIQSVQDERINSYEKDCGEINSKVIEILESM